MKENIDNLVAELNQKVTELNQKVTEINKNGASAKALKEYNDIWFELFKYKHPIIRK
ncbi:MAG: hypothetical protein WCL51_14705 [Bacteroidota bacterium]